eukprot:1087993-Prymnesium_polylepis.2
MRSCLLIKFPSGVSYARKNCRQDLWCNVRSRRAACVRAKSLVTHLENQIEQEDGIQDAADGPPVS